MASWVVAIGAVVSASYNAKHKHYRSHVSTLDFLVCLELVRQQEEHVFGVSSQSDMIVFHKTDHELTIVLKLL